MRCSGDFSGGKKTEKEKRGEEEREVAAAQEEGEEGVRVRERGRAS